MVEGEDFLAVEVGEGDLGGADAMAFLLRKERPAKKTRMKRKTEVNSDFSLHLRHFNRVAIKMKRHRLGG